MHYARKQKKMEVWLGKNFKKNLVKEKEKIAYLLEEVMPSIFVC
jgi:hypothetical protein